MIALLLLLFASSPPAATCEPAALGPGSLPTPAGFCVPPFAARIAPLSESERAAMRGISWREGCPVALNDLRVVTLGRWTLEGDAAEGALVVHRSVAEPIVKAFEGLWRARFPVERMEPVEAFGGDDGRSMAANNTSGFNCRPIAGTTRFSRHAYGDALDLNPRQNPWVSGRNVQPPEGKPWADRTKVEPGVIVDGGPVVRAFEAVGWKWGGRWKRVKDYQHFSRDGS